jgi:hypothetical protein
MLIADDNSAPLKSSAKELTVVHCPNQFCSVVQTVYGPQQSTSILAKMLEYRGEYCRR